MAPKVHENPAKAGDAPPASSAASSDDPMMRSTIDEVESAAACCTLCPPKISCVCCRRERKGDLKRATLGFFGSQRRKCTDVLCLLFFALFWVGMLVIGGIALSQGNPLKILHGSDYRARTCGLGEGVEDLPLTAYPRLIEDFVLNVQSADPTSWKFYGVCTDKCPTRLSVLCNSEIVGASVAKNESQIRYCITDGRDGTAPNPSSFCEDSKINANCWIIPIETKPTLYRCIPVTNSSSSSNSSCTYPSGISNPNDPACLVKTVTSNGVTELPARESMLIEQLATVQSLWSRYFGDIARAFVPIMVCSVFIAVVIGVLYLIFLQYCTWIVVIATIALTLIGLACAAGFAYFKAGILTSPAFADTAASSLGVSLGTATSETSQTAYSVLAYVMTALALLALVLVVVLRNAISTTVATISLASQAIRKNMFLLLVPMASTAAVLALLGWWAFSAASLMSITTTVQVPGFSNSSQLTANLGLSSNISAAAFSALEQESTMNYLQFYNLFGLLWTGQFILYLSFLVIAGTASSWYFARNQKECVERDIPYFKAEDEASPCCGFCGCGIFRTLCCLSCHRTFRFHTGSAAFAAFIVAIIAMVRLIVAYIQKKLEQTKASNNTILRAVLCYIQYCLAIVDCLVRMISRTAFVFVAIKGHSFVPATGKALSFILGNVGTFGLLNVLSAVLLFLGKLLIAGIAAGCCWAFLESSYATYEITSSWLPAAVTFLFAYIVGAVFMDVYDACIDTILVAYVMDKTENGSPIHSRDSDAIDIEKDVDHATGVHEGTAKPKSTRGCCYFLCCCFGTTRSPSSSEEGTELSPAGGTAVSGPASASVGVEKRHVAAGAE